MGVVVISRWKNQDPEEQAREHDVVAAKVIDTARGLGNIHHRVYHAPDTNEGIVIDEWESRDGVDKFYSSEEFQSVLAASGFSPPEEVIVLDELPGDPNLRY